MPKFAVCGGQLSEPVGEVTSPNYPNQYPNDRQCEWMIVMPTGRQIVLNVTDFRLESHPSCDNDYLEVRYVNGDNSGFSCRCRSCIDAATLSSSCHCRLLKRQYVSGKWLHAMEVSYRTRCNSLSNFCQSLLQTSLESNRILLVFHQFFITHVDKVEDLAIINIA